MTVIQRKDAGMAGAIDEFLDEMKLTEDVKSVFYREVLNQASFALVNGSSTSQSHQMATDLSDYVSSLGREQKKASKSRWISEMLKPLLDGLSQYISTADVAIQAGPAGAVAVYAGARLLLQLAKGFSDCFDLVIDTMSQIGRLLSAYSRFLDAYKDDAEMRKALKDSYKTILSFWQRAATLFSRKHYLTEAYKTFFRSVTQPYMQEWTEVRRRLADDRDIVQFLAQSTRDVRMEEDRKDSRRLAIVRWIAGKENPPDVRAQLHELQALRTNGTCRWLFDDEEIISWKTSNKSQILWLSGKPGQGKSVSSAALLGWLQDQDLKTAYFFCSFRDPVRNSPLAMLKSLSLQLLALTQDIPDDVQSIFQQEMTQHLLTEIQTPQVALQVFQNLLKRIGRVHVVIDGLDECVNRDLLLHLLLSMFGTESLGLVKWFCSSRYEVDFEKLFQRLHGVRRVSPSDESIMQDITIFVEQHEASHRHSAKCLESNKKASEANFLWMSLTARTLSGADSTCDEELREELKKFPKGLNGCYQRILRHLMQRPGNQQKLASLIFMFVSHSANPLTLLEVSHAIAARDGAFDFSRDRIPRRELIEQLCHPLIELDPIADSPDNAFLRPVHATVKDFFAQDPNSLGVERDLHLFFTSEKDADLEIGKRCLTYLMYHRYQNELQEGLDLQDSLDKNHAFLRYASVFWHYHLNNVNHDQDIFEMIAKFIKSPNFWTCVQVQKMAAPHLFCKLTPQDHNDAQTGTFSVQLGGKIGAKPSDDLYFGCPLPLWLDLYHDGVKILKAYSTWIKEWHAVLQRQSTSLHCDPKIIGEIGGVFSNTTGQDEIFVLPGRPHAMDVPDYGSATLETGLSAHVEEYIIRCEIRSSLSRSLQLEDPVTSFFSPDHLIRPDSPESLSIILDELRRESQDSDPTSVSQWLREILRQHSTSSREPPDQYRAPSIAFGSTLDIGAETKDPDDSSEADSDESDVEDTLDSSFRSSNVASPWGSCIQTHMVLACDAYDMFATEWTSSLPYKFCMTACMNQKDGTTFWNSSAGEVISRKIDSTSTGGRKRVCIGGILEPSKIVRTELHISPQSNILHILTWSLNWKYIFARYRVHLQSIPLEDFDDEGSACLSGYIQSFDFKCESMGIENPVESVVTSWTDTHVYLLMPIPSPYAKFVRFELPSPFVSPSQTHVLDSSVDLPASTPWRRPSLIVEERTDNESPLMDERITLLLDSRELPLPSELGTDQDILPGLIFRWTASKLGGWKDWDDVQEQHNLMQGQVSAAVLRANLKGDFIDSNQRFNVPVRSGLDWTKKAYLSCW
ncbi:MAG: hypothetical protein M1831_004425 [Alyxoria varia]|nr:MAG: hypothetical protein M1831_004425 [Alyxoria varia]